MATITSPNVVYVTAGEDLAAGDCVFLASNAPYLYSSVTEGRAYKTTKDLRHKSVNANLQGFVVSQSSSGQVAKIKVQGLLSGFSGLTAGQFYQPASSSGTIEIYVHDRASCPPVAIAVSTTEIQILFQSWEIRGKGYCMGGLSGSTFHTTVDYISFSTDSAVTSGGLSVGRLHTHGAQSQTKAYVAGGFLPSWVVTNTITGALFSNGVFASLSATLTNSRIVSTGTASSTKGYWAGGSNGAENSFYSVIDALTFSGETVASLSATISTARSHMTGAITPLRGYYLGGGTPNTRIESLTFSNETMETSSSVFSVGRDLGAGINSSTKMYCMASGIGPSASVESIAVSNESVSSVGNVGTARYGLCGVSSAIKGYGVAGFTGSDTNYTYIDSVSFSTETITRAGDVTVARRLLGGASS
jgi:hypothetical protein